MPDQIMVDYSVKVAIIDCTGHMPMLVIILPSYLYW